MTTIQIKNININNDCLLYKLLDQHGFGASGTMVDFGKFELTFSPEDVDFKLLVADLILTEFKVVRL